jgi:hypothetical protein
VRIFADFKYAKNTTPLLIPSLNKFSWTKGFLTYDHRDARPYEVEPLTPLISPEPKPRAVKIEQKYRVQLACPCLKKQETAGENTTNLLFAHTREQVVTGADPRTFNLSEPVSTDHLAASMRFDFSFEVGMSKTTRPVEVDLAFSGTKGGQPITWRSQWQPASIEAGPDWKKHTYSSLLPADFDQWRNTLVLFQCRPLLQINCICIPKKHSVPK